MTKQNGQFESGNIAGITYRVGHYYYSPVNGQTYRCVATRTAPYEGHDIAHVGTFVEDNSCIIEALFIDNEQTYGFRVGDDGIIYFAGDVPVIDSTTMAPMTIDSDRAEIRKFTITPTTINIKDSSD